MENEVRRAVAQAGADEKAGVIIGLDMMALGGAAWAYSGSWVWGVVAAAITGWAFSLKGVSDLLALAMSVGWAALAYLAARHFSLTIIESCASTGVAAVVAWGMHLQGIRHLQSFKAEPPKP